MHLAFVISPNAITQNAGIAVTNCIEILDDFFFIIFVFITNKFGASQEAFLLLGFVHFFEQLFIVYIGNTYERDVLDFYFFFQVDVKGKFDRVQPCGIRCFQHINVYIQPALFDKAFFQAPRGVRFHVLGYNPPFSDVLIHYFIEGFVLAFAYTFIGIE